VRAFIISGFSREGNCIPDEPIVKFEIQMISEEEEERGDRSRGEGEGVFGTTGLEHT
jgi:hypothetical protein